MAFNTKLADEVREYLADFPQFEIKEKRMFGGLAFMVNKKMCVNVSGDRLMCRFNPEREAEVTEKPGYEPMVMKGKELSGYCYVNAERIRSPSDLKYWVDLCLDFNKAAKKSK
ncbi:TfoX/Sxy family protein [Cryomorpha ignava]|uniref:TfoX/Sxy family protein n=1 Tax=Cryomorpha ignava TaxID=101383 RepID=A0A7K3WV71_9FLAO|nr:TfoX/Sxy family protein [Cryomorpha ignava]NEN25418.1 TfoX/Sxy family protein [Cryomorpha ignava]